MSDLNWALLMGVIAIVQSFRADYHAREAIRKEAALRDKFNEGYQEGADHMESMDSEGHKALANSAMKGR